MEKVTKKRTVLSVDETSKLIGIWRNHVDDLKDTKRNWHILAKMGEELHNVYQIKLTPEEIRTRVNNLKKKFRSEKKSIACGGAPSEWEHFEEVKELLANYKMNPVEVFMLETNDSSNYENMETSSSARSLCLDPTDPGPSEFAASSPKRPKKKDLILEKFFELASEEAKVFKEFAIQCIENDKKKIELLEKNNQIQEQLIKLFSQNK